MAPAHPSRALRTLQSHSVRPPRCSTSALLSRSLFLTPTAHNPRHSSTHTSAPNPNPHPPTSTVDPTEVSHFNALASSWWDPHGPSRLLHLMNPLRHTFISRCRATANTSTTASLEPPQLRYLDIGCGGGIFAESAARLKGTRSVTAIDPSPEVLRIAEEHRRRDPALVGKGEGGGEGKLTYLGMGIEDLKGYKAGVKGADGQEGYDIVTLFEVLEHVNAPGPFLEHVLQHVKPGGWLVLSTIARTWTSWLVTNVVAEDVLGIVPKGTHEWAKYVNESELREWFAKKQGWGGNGGVQAMGVVYVPGLGWKEVNGGEAWGNYFFGIRKEG